MERKGLLAGAVRGRGEQRGRKQLLATSLLGISLLALATCACGADTTESKNHGASRSSGRLPQGSERVKLDPAHFTTSIDNPYWPMAPGNKWVYKETEEGEQYDVEVTVTDRTKIIANGVEARVIHDVVSQHGQPVEVTDDPRDGMAYRQEYYRGEAEDRAEVLSTQEQVEAPFGHFAGALLTKDLVPTEPKVSEYKLYAKNVGPVMTVQTSGGSSREELISYTRAN